MTTNWIKAINYELAAMDLPEDLTLVAYGVRDNTNIVVLQDPEESEPLYFTKPVQVFRLIVQLRVVVDRLLALKVPKEDEASIHFDGHIGYYFEPKEQERNV